MQTSADWSGGMQIQQTNSIKYAALLNHPTSHTHLPSPAPRILTKLSALKSRIFHSFCMNESNEVDNPSLTLYPNL